ncbi:unnamed protein product [Meganyctiphanes norvegica]|uniref:BZIP domain-containing protein n=1 Tax=Meganyctiphanes norvegica TaxID=48144 RepID=A0AAV2Q5X1_MEGNR
MELASALIEDGGGGAGSTNAAAATMLAFNTSHFGDLRAQDQLEHNLRLQQKQRLHPDTNGNQQQQLHVSHQQQQQQHVRTHAHLQQIRQAIQLQQLQQHQQQQQQSTGQQQQQQQQYQQQPQHQQYATSSSPLQGTVANMPDSPNTPGSSCAKEEDKSDNEWQPYPESAFLGPTLWDKTLPFESQQKQTTSCKQRPDIKLSLEYMDLDDFLNENNLHTGSNGSSRNSNSISASSAESSSKGPQASSPLHAETPTSPDPTAAMMGTGLGACMGETMGSSLRTSQNMGMCSPPVMSPNDLGPPLSPASPADSHSTMMNNEYHNDLHPELRPGFDPRTHCFSEDELKPQPIVKKSRKQFVPCDLKDDRYWDRRNKNNAAAKRSRDARRMKENQIAMRASFLEKENNALTIEIEQANAMVESLKKRLSMYEAV